MVVRVVVLTKVVVLVITTVGPIVINVEIRAVACKQCTSKYYRIIDSNNSISSGSRKGGCSKSISRSRLCHTFSLLPALLPHIVLFCRLIWVRVKRRP